LEDIKMIEDKLNNGSRKVLNWKTKNEVFYSLEMVAKSKNWYDFFNFKIVL
jgi:IS30 family transposase